jgi:hypothetical protein
MTNRLRLSLSLLLIVINIFLPAVAVAQSTPQETFLPSIGGYVEPLPPPAIQPAPYDINARDLVIGTEDLARANNYDYEMTQDEAIEITEGLRGIGAVNGYITYLVNREEDVRKGPFELGSYALVFMNGEQAQAYFKAAKQGYIDEGLERLDYNYDDLGSGYPDPSVVYVQRETIQGFHVRQTYALAYEGNVFVTTYVFDLEERSSAETYAGWMLDKFAPDREPASASAHPYE